MSAHRAAECFEVSESDPRVAEPRRMLDKFLWMTRATEKCVVAQHRKLTPLLRWGPADMRSNA